jgi:hypothetical protein
MRFRLLLACCPFVLSAQSIAVPQSGFVFDRSPQVFRPVLGVPGASILGEPLDINNDLHTVEACSRQQFALAAAGRGGVVTLIHLDTLKSTSLPPALVDFPDSIQLSAGCSTAVVYSAAANRLQIVTGLPANPTLAADVTPPIPGRISALTVSEDGQFVLAAFPGAAVYLIPATGRALSLLSIKEDAVVAFRDNGDAIVADQFSNTVTLIANPAGSASRTVLAGPEAGIDIPSAVWFDSRTQNVGVADSGTGRIQLLPVAGGSSDVLACGCRLSGVAPLTDRTYELQAAAAGQPLQILDLGSSPPRVVFIATPEPGKFHKERRN